jgi:hypothetical protein
VAGRREAEEDAALSNREARRGGGRGMRGRGGVGRWVGVHRGRSVGWARPLGPGDESCWPVTLIYIYEFTCFFQFKQKIIKLKITTLLHSLDDYKVLLVKRCLKIYKKYNDEIINELKYIISVQRAVIIHNAIY